MYRYQIIGQDRRYQFKESYGYFETLRECLEHMERLRRSFGTIIKFRMVEC